MRLQFIVESDVGDDPHFRSVFRKHWRADQLGGHLGSFQIHLARLGICRRGNG
jgi:hypothetical protein